MTVIDVYVLSNLIDTRICICDVLTPQVAVAIIYLHLVKKQLNGLLQMIIESTKLLSIIVFPDDDHDWQYASVSQKCFLQMLYIFVKNPTKIFNARFNSNLPRTQTKVMYTRSTPIIQPLPICYCISVGVIRMYKIRWFKIVI